MPYTVVFAPEADDQLEELYLYIAEPDTGLLLPCNVVVRQEPKGTSRSVSLTHRSWSA